MLIKLSKLQKLNPPTPFVDDFTDNFDKTYWIYKKWLSNHTDLQVGANQLTNLQLYWVANSVSRFTKYHRNVPKTYSRRLRLQFAHLHVFYKNKPGFQDAFGCNATEEERKEFKEATSKEEAFIFD